MSKPVGKRVGFCDLQTLLGLLIPWRRQWQPTPVLLPGKSHGWRSLVGCSPWGRKESDRTERLHFHFSLGLLEGLFTYKKGCFPKDVRGLHKATNVPNFPLSIIHSVQFSSLPSDKNSFSWRHPENVYFCNSSTSEIPCFHHSLLSSHICLHQPQSHTCTKPNFQVHLGL